MLTIIIIALLSITVLSLIAYYLRSICKQMNLQVFLNFTAEYKKICLLFPESINEDAFSFSSMPKEEADKAMRACRAYYDLCFEEFMLNKLGMIDPAFWQVWKGGMIYAFNKSAFKQAWAVMLTDTDYGSEFNNFVNSNVRK